ncbi:MAG: hypothetical protein U9N82_09885 [Thermodesulfobacteriota bacterium]|nr:hypothetical protein [Thermodesulfobacteriota bacterium]
MEKKSHFTQKQKLDILESSKDVGIKKSAVLNVNYFVRFATTILSDFSLSPFLSYHLLF